MINIKQNTAVTLLIGPFLDETDGVTPETGLTIAQADIRLSKNGGNMAQKNDATSCIHDELGYYTCPLDATDSNTLGILKLSVAPSGSLPVWVDIMVLTAEAYDTLYGTDNFTVDLSATALTNVNSEVDTALTDYDGPTNTEMEARTVVSANYALETSVQTSIANIAALQVDITEILDYEAGDWEIVSDQMIFKTKGGSTLATYDLTKDGIPDSSAPDKREKV